MNGERGYVDEGEFQPTIAPSEPPPDASEDFWATYTPNVPTSAGRMYMTPTPIPSLSPDEQAALQARLAAATSRRVGPVMPPTGYAGGVPMPDVGNIYRTAYAHLPIDQASQAVQAALRYQGQRGYQSDLESGMTPAQAMVKWGPMLFPSSPAAVTSSMRAMTPAQTGPVQAVPIIGPDGKPTGQMAYRHGTSGVSVLKPDVPRQPEWVPPDPVTGAPGYFDTGVGTMHIPPRERGPTGGIGPKDILATLRAERKELEANPYIRMAVTPKTSPELKQQIEASKSRLAKVKTQIETMIGGDETPTVTTQAEFDALPPGAVYIGRGGKRYRKP